MRSLKCRSLFIFAALVFGATAAAHGQTTRSGELGSASLSSNVNVVNTPTVGIDPAKNTVQVANSASGPLAVAVTNAPARRPFQARVNLTIPDGANAASDRVNVQRASGSSSRMSPHLRSGPRDKDTCSILRTAFRIRSAKLASLAVLRLTT